MKHVPLVLLFLVLFAAPALAALQTEGMLNVQSEFPVNETANRLETILKEKGMTVFSRINHSNGAKKVGLELRDTELVIFGNPKIGSPLMQCQQSVAIDLPQKALIWQDEKSTTWVSYNNPRYLEKRHKITGCEKVLSKIEKALAAIIKAAATK